MLRPPRASMRLHRFLLVSLVIALFGNMLVPGHALAWKPTTHVFLGELALQDALDNGKVTIYRVNYRTGAIVGTVGEYAVEPTILAALQSNAAQYHAGILGPDAYPDIFTGQQAIHPSFEHTETPGGSEAWLSYLWEQSTYAVNDTPAIKAFTVGYLTHAAGDMFGHTFINNFAGGEFSITPPTGPANAIKHVILEGYLDKRMDTRHLDASVFDVSIGEGVDDFVYRTLVDARNNTYLGGQLLREGAPGTEFSIPRIFSTLRDNLTHDIASYRQAARNCAWWDLTCSAIILNLTADYMEAWRADIDEGLRLWPHVSHEVAVALFYNSERKADVNRAFAILEDYATNHLISMSGAPDFVGLSIAFINDVVDAITPDFFQDEIAKLKEELLNTLLKEAIGMDKDELKQYLTNPELYFDQVMSVGDGEQVTLQQMNNNYLMLSDSGFNNPSEQIEYTKVPAIFNTVTMSKLILLSQSEINRLLDDLRSSAHLDQPNVMLGFIPSLDGSRQWLNGMVFASDSNAYCQVFMVQPGETPINCRPTATPDFYITTNDPLQIAAPGLLANDSDPDGDIITAIISSQPQHGSLSLNSNGSFTYTPNGSAVDDSFSYHILDGTTPSEAVNVTLAAAPTNDPPVSRIDLFQTIENSPFTSPAPGVLQNDHDPDGDPLSALIVTEPNHGTLTLDASGRFVYTPEPFFSGIDTFHYKASDGSHETASTEVGIEVIANPNLLVAISDTYIALQNRPLIVPAPGLLGNDRNRDQLPLSAIDPPVNQIVGGFVTVDASGAFTFTPAPNYFGEGEFSYMASDGRSNSNVSKTRIIIRESNAAPVAENDRYSTTNKAVIEVAAPGILSNDWDPDYHAAYLPLGLPASDPKEAMLIDAPSTGTLTLRTDGSFVYTPSVTFTGRDSFTYKVSDGWDESITATVRIADSTLNQLPVAHDDHYATGKNSQLQQAAPGILANDKDSDGDPLILLPERVPVSGSVKLNFDGSFVYSPTVDFVGVDSFTYSIGDGLGITQTATVTVVVGDSATYLPLVQR